MDQGYTIKRGKGGGLLETGTDMLKLTLGKRKRRVLGDVGKDKGKGIGF